MTKELTISQAIRYSSKLKSQISDSRDRALSSFIYNKNETPAFNFAEMLSKADSLSSELAELQGKIAFANSNNTIEYKGSVINIAHAIRILQELKGRIAWAKNLPALASAITTHQDAEYDENTGKYNKKTLEKVCCLAQADKANLIDSLQEEFDTLNGIVEFSNQTVKITI